MIKKSIRTIRILLLTTACLSLFTTTAGSIAFAEVKKNPVTAETKKDSTANPVLLQDSTLRKEDAGTQLDFSGGAFIPAGDLADGMEAGWAFGINIRTPFLHIVPLSAPAGFVSVMKQFEVGLHFSYIAGRNPDNSGSKIAFAPMLLDVYYTIPLNLKGFAFYVYNGLGASLASTVADRDPGTEHEQSIDFALRPGVGCEYNFADRVYLRLNAGYFVCFESEIGMGAITSFGVGYAY